MTAPQVPTTVTIELEEKDIRNDLAHIIESMEAIRREQLTENRVTDESKNEYLHLAYRLASAVDALAEGEVRTRINDILKAADENPALLWYDFLQDRYWSGIMPEFTKGLDRILILLKGDDFSGVEEKHHLFNALKYLGSQSEPLERRLKIYDTVLPFNQPPSFKDGDDVMRHLRDRGLKVEGVDNLTLRLQDEPQTIEDVKRLANTAAFFGFRRVRVVVTPELYKEIGKMPLTHNIVMDGGCEEDKKEAGNHKKGFRIPKIFYPVLGSLPGGLQQSIQDMLGGKKFNALEASAYSAFTFTTLSLVSLPATGIISLLKNDTPEIDFLMPGAFVHSIIEANRFIRIGSHHKPIGNWLVSILASPYYLFRNKAKSNTASHKSKDTKLPVELWVPEKPETEIDKDYIKHIKSKRIGRHNFHPLMEELAALVLSDKEEENLIWKLENHHTQGKDFARSLFSSNEGRSNGKGYFIAIEHLDRMNGSLTLYDVLHTTGYNKVSALVCMKGKRYALTYVSDGKDALNVDALSSTLAQDLPIKEKVQRVAEMTGAEHLHLSYFDNCKKVEDITVTR